MKGNVISALICPNTISYRSFFDAFRDESVYTIKKKLIKIPQRGD